MPPSLLPPPEKSRPLTCGAGDGHKGCRAKAVLKSIQLPFCGEPSETQRSLVRPADTKALTERRGQGQTALQWPPPWSWCFSLWRNAHPPASFEPLLKCPVSTDDFFHQQIHPSPQILQICDLLSTPNCMVLFSLWYLTAQYVVI